MHANIAICNRTKQSVGQGMQSNIAIRMRIYTLIMRNIYAANPNMITGFEFMYVKTLSRSDVRQRSYGFRKALFSHDDILSCRNFYIATTTLDNLHGDPRPLRHAGVIREIAPILSGSSLMNC